MHSLVVSDLRRFWGTWLQAVASAQTNLYWRWETLTGGETSERPSCRSRPVSNHVVLWLCTIHRWNAETYANFSTSFGECYTVKLWASAPTPTCILPPCTRKFRKVTRIVREPPLPTCAVRADSLLALAQLAFFVWFVLVIYNNFNYTLYITLMPRNAPTLSLVHNTCPCQSIIMLAHGNFFSHRKRFIKQILCVI